MSRSRQDNQAGNGKEEVPPATQGGDSTPVQAPPDGASNPDPTHHKVRIIAEPGEEDDRTSRPSPTSEPTSCTPSSRSVTKPPQKADPLLRTQEVVKGSHPGDTYVRYGRNAGAFRRQGGVLSASLETADASGCLGPLFLSHQARADRRPISTEQSIHERLTNVKALAVLSSDALSSVAYATEEILRVLILATVAGGLGFTLPIGFAVMLLLAIVAISYRQTIAAYPRGGGSYIVAKDNLGTLPGLTAAASILIDYTMTVAVSTTAGVAALYSLFPSLQSIRVEICVGIVILVTIANLRGVREAGNIFAVPTYLFVFGILAMVAYGMLRTYLGIGGQPVVYVRLPGRTGGRRGITLFLLLRAFTQGCTALTGVEAIADGVPAFKPP